jgi:hypothetical protein
MLLFLPASSQLKKLSDKNRKITIFFTFIWLLFCSPKLAQHIEVQYYKKRLSFQTAFLLFLKVFYYRQFVTGSNPGDPSPRPTSNSKSPFGAYISKLISPY